MRLQIKNGWIFGPREDLMAFGGSILIGLLGTWFFATVTQSWAIKPGWYVLVFHILLDRGHGHASIFRTYLDPVELRRRGWLYLVLPIAYVAIFAGLNSVDRLWFWRTFAYLNLAHNVQQQYGWITYSMSRAEGVTKTKSWLDRACIYLLSLAPIAWMHSRGVRSFFVQGDLIPCPPEWEPYFHAACWGALGLVVLVQAISCLKSRTVNVAKIVILLTTFAAFYLAFGYFPTFYAVGAGFHAIPYFFVLNKYRETRSARAMGRAAAVGALRWSGVILIVFVAGVSAFGEVSVWQATRPGILFELPFIRIAPIRISRFQSVLEAMLMYVNFFHIFTDSYLWKRNPRNILLPAAEPELENARLAV